MAGIILSRQLIILILCLQSVACGFRLAGTANLPPALQSIQLVTRDFNQRQRDALHRSLKRAGAEISFQPLDGAVLLSVVWKSLPDRRLVSSADSGRKVERLTRRLTFRLNGDGLSVSKTLTQQKDILLDDDNLLASNVERSEVVEELEQALFRQLLIQLQRI